MKQTLIMLFLAAGTLGPRNFFSVKVLRVDLEAGFKRLFSC